MSAWVVSVPCRGLVVFRVALEERMDEMQARVSVPCRGLVVFRALAQGPGEGIEEKFPSPVGD